MFLNILSRNKIQTCAQLIEFMNKNLPSGTYFHTLFGRKKFLKFTGSMVIATAITTIAITIIIMITTVTVGARG